MLIFEMCETIVMTKNKQHSLEKKFLDFISKENIISKKEPLLLAISGGKDSVCLFHLLHSQKFPFACAHVNFKLRGAESDKDEAFVRALCKKYNIVLHTTHFETDAIAKQNKISIQMAARELRYQWFQTLCENHGYSKTVTAHHLMDNTETILLNLVRGSSIDGLIGIKTVQQKIVRPLLFAELEEILSYLKTNRLKFREDSSNASIKYKRNSIRHKVMPELQKLNPNLNQTLFDNSKHLQDIQRFIQASFQSFKTYFISDSEDGNEVLQLHTAIPEYFIHEWLHPYGFNSTQTQAVHQLLKAESGKLISNKQYQVSKDRQTLILSKKSTIKNDTVVFNNLTELMQYEAFNVEVIPSNKMKSLKVNTNSALFDLDKIQFPLTLINKYQNEKFKPLGLNYFVKVADFLIQKKVALIEKSKVNLLMQKDMVIWVLKMRSDNRFKVDTKTQTVLKITCN